MLLWRGRSREEQEPRAAPCAERVRHEQPRPVAPPETSAGPQWAPGSGSLWEVLSLTLGAWLWVRGGAVQRTETSARGVSRLCRYVGPAATKLIWDSVDITGTGKKRELSLRLCLVPDEGAGRCL